MHSPSENSPTHPICTTLQIFKQCVLVKVHQYCYCAAREAQQIPRDASGIHPSWEMTFDRPLKLYQKSVQEFLMYSCITKTSSDGIEYVLMYTRKNPLYHKWMCSWHHVSIFVWAQNQAECLYAKYMYIGNNIYLHGTIYVHAGKMDQFTV